ncbi:hypothetical protein ACJX0J_035942 [Zea mays]
MTFTFGAIVWLPLPPQQHFVSKNGGTYIGFTINDNLLIYVNSYNLLICWNRLYDSKEKRSTFVHNKHYLSRKVPAIYNSQDLIDLKPNLLRKNMGSMIYSFEVNIKQGNTIFIDSGFPRANGEQLSGKQSLLFIHVICIVVVTLRAVDEDVWEMGHAMWGWLIFFFPIERYIAESCM